MRSEYITSGDPSFNIELIAISHNCCCHALLSAVVSTPMYGGVWELLEQRLIMRTMTTVAPVMCTPISDIATVTTLLNIIIFQ